VHPQTDNRQETSVINSLRVLIVDGDDVFRKLCARALRNAPVHYELLFAATGSEAELRYQLGDLDCVLVDYRLPDTTGTVVMRTLQPEPDPSVPIIMLTDTCSQEVLLESLHAGVADYLAKQDVNSASLHRAIQNAVDKAQLHRLLVERNIELEQTNVKLTEKNEQIQRFCHVMSHEMKTPLAAAREFVSLVMDGVIGEVSAEQTRMLALAMDSCDELAGHFNDLIESIRIDTGRLELHKSRTGMPEQVARCVAAVSALAKRKNIVIGQKLDEQLPLLDMDPHRVRQVISNLLTNALKFTDDGGLVTVSARVMSDWRIQVAVSDTGCGIAQSDLPRVFDRLYQVGQRDVPQARTGLGLGLAISREIVEMHGGTIAIRSRLGSGTTVEFYLPLPDRERDVREPLPFVRRHA
jgi:signal transduction histidine kinase